MDSKKELRKKALALRQELLNNGQHKILSDKIQDNILASNLYKNCKIVCLYASTRGEVETSLIAKNAFSCGKSVYYPKCHQTEPGQMSYIKCQNFDDLQLGKYGILEPKSNIVIKKSLLNEADTLIFVPSLLFDKQGVRLGYGQGYYDRLLAENKLAISMGLAFSEHLQEKLPKMDWDISVQYLAHEFGIVKTSN